MSEDTVLPFDLPSVCRKKVRVGFDGGRLSSDGGVLLLRGAERKLGLASRLAGCLRDKRDPDLIEHTLEEMLRLRLFAIAAGYEDADDCDWLRHDPMFKLAVGRLPESGQPLCSQPTMSRLENAPSKIELARLMAAMVDQFCASYRRPPASIVLDIDDTCDTVHGHQQLSLFNAYYDERCFLPIHIYEGHSGKPVAMILRSGKTPSGEEVRCVLKHVIKRIRRHWPRTHILVRGDSHYGRVEAMAWCEKTPGVDYVLGFAVNAVLKALTDAQAQALARARSRSGHDKLRRFMTFDYAAKGWDKPRRFVARIEATAPAASMCAMSCPRSRQTPGTSTRRSTARAAAARTSSSGTRASSLPTAPRAVSLRPTSSASSSIPPPTGSCSPYARRPPSGRLSRSPSSPPCACI